MFCVLRPSVEVVKEGWISTKWEFFTEKRVENIPPPSTASLEIV